MILKHSISKRNNVFYLGQTLFERFAFIAFLWILRYMQLI